MGILYAPEDGVAADFIPFYWKGDYHLFFLKDYRDAEAHGQGTPWWHLVTRDFVHFEDLGEALPRGPAGSQDVWVFTGSVIEKDQAFHIFYTGHNRNFRGTGKPIEAVMHATSGDLQSWMKDPTFRLFAPTQQGYEADNWRDPFVFWNEEEGEYCMLLAARRHKGPSRNRGLIALAASGNLRDWVVREPFWAPDIYYTHECPDLFRIGDWWYLVYSTFSERTVTHYRMSRSLAGPWLAPGNDTFDGRAYYAAKTAGDGHRRFAFGWLPTRAGDTDEGDHQWGGRLVVHELVQAKDGTLAVRVPETIAASFTRILPLTPQPWLGAWQAGGSISARALGRFSALSLVAMPEECLIQTSIVFSEETASAGLLLHADNELEHYYQVRLEPANQRIVVDRWPRPGDQPFMLERPLGMKPQAPLRLEVLIDGACTVVYANGEVALSCRMCKRHVGAAGLFVAEGNAEFRGTTLRTRQ